MVYTFRIMVHVHFTSALKRFVPDLQSIDAEGTTVADVITAVETAYPGLSDYLVEENGTLRKHVHIFINDAFIRDRRKLSDGIRSGDHVHIIQALSGG